MPSIIKNSMEVKQLICKTILLLNLDITGIDTIAIPKLIHPAQIVANWLFCCVKPAALNIDAE